MISTSCHIGRSRGPLATLISLVFFQLTSSINIFWALIRLVCEDVKTDVSSTYSRSVMQYHPQDVARDCFHHSVNNGIEHMRQYHCLHAATDGFHHSVNSGVEQASLTNATVVLRADGYPNT